MWIYKWKIYSQNAISVSPTKTLGCKQKHNCVPDWAAIVHLLVVPCGSIQGKVLLGVSLFAGEGVGGSIHLLPPPSACVLTSYLTFCTAPVRSPQAASRIVEIAGGKRDAALSFWPAACSALQLCPSPQAKLDNLSEGIILHCSIRWSCGEDWHFEIGTAKSYRTRFYFHNISLSVEYGFFVKNSFSAKSTLVRLGKSLTIRITNKLNFKGEATCLLIKLKINRNCAKIIWINIKKIWII